MVNGRQTPAERLATVVKAAENARAQTITVGQLRPQDNAAAQPPTPTRG